MCAPRWYNDYIFDLDDLNDVLYLLDVYDLNLDHADHLVQHPYDVKYLLDEQHHFILDKQHVHAALDFVEHLDEYDRIVNDLDIVHDSARRYDDLDDDHCACVDGRLPDADLRR